MLWIIMYSGFLFVDTQKRREQEQEQEEERR